VLDKDGDEIDLKQSFDDDNMGLVMKDDELFDNVGVEVESEIADGFEVEHESDLLGDDDLTDDEFGEDEDDDDLLILPDDDDVADDEF
jgi:DNA-directed RNA polymerase subunit beta